MAEYKFTIAHPPLLKDFGVSRIVAIKDCLDAPQIMTGEIDYLKLSPKDALVPGLVNVKAKVIITTTKAWVRIGDVATLASDETVSITETLSQSVESLNSLRALVALELGAEIKVFTANVKAEIEYTETETKNWSSSTSNTITVSRKAFHTYADWILVNRIRVDYDTKDVIKVIENSKKFSDGGDQFFKILNEARANALGRAKKLDTQLDEYETLAGHRYEDVLVDNDKILQEHLGTNAIEGTPEPVFNG